jgi:hypothetical protein
MDEWMMNDCFTELFLYIMDDCLHDRKQFLVALLMMYTLVNKYDFDFDFGITDIYSHTCKSPALAMSTDARRSLFARFFVTFSMWVVRSFSPVVQHKKKLGLRVLSRDIHVSGVD